MVCDEYVGITQFFSSLCEVFDCCRVWFYLCLGKYNSNFHVLLLIQPRLAKGIGQRISSQTGPFRFQTTFRPKGCTDQIPFMECGGGFGLSAVYHPYDFTRGAGYNEWSESQKRNSVTNQEMTWRVRVEEKIEEPWYQPSLS